ncbi:MAG: Maf family protein [Burkholderiaceae bacterium]
MIWLASKSPRRQQLLRQIGVAFEVLLPEDAEAAEALEATRQGEPPNAYVQRVALAKLALARDSAQAGTAAQRPILCADTTVAIGGRILGKPDDDEQALQMLRLLSGRTHRVITAVAVWRAGKVRHRVQVSRVRFARLTDAQMRAYVAGGEGRDKAGGYGIQGVAGGFVKRIEGSHSGIMGLPLYDTRLLLGI